LNFAGGDKVAVAETSEWRGASESAIRVVMAKLLTLAIQRAGTIS
jgi:hypothetical protein